MKEGGILIWKKNASLFSRKKMTEKKKEEKKKKGNLESPLAVCSMQHTPSSPVVIRQLG
jgi:hypothetical protein